MFFRRKECEHPFAAVVASKHVRTTGRHEDIETHHMELTCRKCGAVLPLEWITAGEFVATRVQNCPLPGTQKPPKFEYGAR